jgi:hypothetical protein
MNGAREINEKAEKANPQTSLENGVEFPNERFSMKWAERRL